LFGCGTLGPDLLHMDDERINRRVNSKVRGIDYRQVQGIRLPTQVRCPAVHPRVRKLGLPAGPDEPRMADSRRAVQQDYSHKGCAGSLNSAADE